MSLGSKINAIMLIRKFVRNWISVSIKVANNQNATIVLRSGEKIHSLKDPFGLVTLLYHEWRIEDHDDRFIVLKNRNDVRLKCRIREDMI